MQQARNLEAFFEQEERYPCPDGGASYSHAWHVVRFFNTCGQRFCKSIGYSTGWLQEAFSEDNVLVNCVR